MQSLTNAMLSNESAGLTRYADVDSRDHQMTTNPLTDALEPDFQTVFDALTSEQCRVVLKHLDHPMTAAELAEDCDLPRSTVYRKVELLVESGLLEKRTRGAAATQYTLGFDEIRVTRGDDGLSLSVSKSAQSASEQLSKMWSTLQDETGGDA